MNIRLGQRACFIDPESGCVKRGFVTQIHDDGTCVVCNDLRFMNRDFFDIEWAQSIPVSALLRDWYAHDDSDPILDEGEQLSWNIS